MNDSMVADLVADSLSQMAPSADMGALVPHMQHDEGGDGDLGALMDPSGSMESRAASVAAASVAGLSRHQHDPDRAERPRSDPQQPDFHRPATVTIAAAHRQSDALAAYMTTYGEEDGKLFAALRRHAGNALRVDDVDWQAIRWAPWTAASLRARWHQLIERVDAQGTLQQQILKVEQAYTEALRLRQVVSSATQLKLKKGARRQRSKKEPMSPKRPMTAYMLFLVDFRRRERQARPTARMIDLTREAGRQWRFMQPDEKRKYELESSKQRHEYHKQMAEYRRAHPRPSQQPCESDRPAALDESGGIASNEDRPVGHRKRRDPSAPKRPLTPYMLFLSAERPLEKSHNPSETMMEITKRLAARWRSMSESEKVRLTPPARGAVPGVYLTRSRPRPRPVRRRLTMRRRNAASGSTRRVWPSMRLRSGSIWLSSCTWRRIAKRR